MLLCRFTNILYTVPLLMFWYFIHAFLKPFNARHLWRSIAGNIGHKFLKCNKPQGKKIPQVSHNLFSQQYQTPEQTLWLANGNPQPGTMCQDCHTRVIFIGCCTQNNVTKCHLERTTVWTELPKKCIFPLIKLHISFQSGKNTLLSFF